MFKLSKSQRLCRQIEFRQLLSCGQKTFTPWFILRHQENGLETSRLGIAFSKKKV